VAAGWKRPGAFLKLNLARAGGAIDVSRYGVLDLRAAMNRRDPRNPLGDGYTPNLVTQDFDVTIADASGRRATTRASRWSTSLEPSIGNQGHITLNGIRIPLHTFAGVDLTRAVSVELGFGHPPIASIHLA